MIVSACLEADFMMIMDGNWVAKKGSFELPFYLISTGRDQK